MNILVVDDSASILTLIASIIEDLGYQCTAVNSGKKAIATHKKLDQAPDLVILDIIMDGMDGYETGKQLKRMAGNTHLPIIFLTGSQEPDIHTKCLAIGDDYISKPFSVEMVVIKIKAHLRVSLLTKKMHEKNLELRKRDAAVKNEHRIVESIFANHFQKHIIHPNIAYHMSPVSVFNGDVLLVADGPSGNTYILIGDATGHGLPAAVAAIPIYTAFRTMASKGLTVGLIASELNKSLLQLLPSHMMLAAAILEINIHTNELTIWSGGVPSVIVTDSLGNIKNNIPAFHAPLAAMEEHEFLQTIQAYNLEENDHIYMFTDGIEESRNTKNEMFGEERLLKLFNGKKKNLFNAIIANHNKFIQNTQQDDDITLVEFTFNKNTNGNLLSTKQRDYPHIFPWSMQFHLSAEDIRQSNPVPYIIRLIDRAPAVEVHQDFISTILSELYNNALDHGLLKLDSVVKNDDDGFINYYQQRLHRLTQLESGHIDISIQCLPSAKNHFLKITVKDSGDGYTKKYLQEHQQSESHGRGLLLVKKLSQKMLVRNNGSTITVMYHLN